MVATANAAALTLFAQLSEYVPILDVPVPQKKVAGLREHDGSQFKFSGSAWGDGLALVTIHTTMHSV